MKIFISWSGDRSRQVAELLQEWIKCVIQAADPWISSSGIERGSLWFNAINSALADTNIGIICLTKENRNKPWILFESGALAKGLSTNLVCTFLIDLNSSDLESPLSQFNATKPDKEGLLSLVKTINYSISISQPTLGLTEKTLDRVFETYWPQFETNFESILSQTIEMPEMPARSENEIMLEILSSVRGMEKRIQNIENDPYKSVKSLSQKLKMDELRKKYNVVDNTSTLNDFRQIIDKEVSKYIHQGLSRDEALERIKGEMTSISDKVDLIYNVSA